MSKGRAETGERKKITADHDQIHKFPKIVSLSEARASKCMT